MNNTNRNRYLIIFALFFIFTIRYKLSSPISHHLLYARKHPRHHIIQLHPRRKHNRKPSVHTQQSQQHWYARFLQLQIPKKCKMRHQLRKYLSSYRQHWKDISAVPYQQGRHPREKHCGFIYCCRQPNPLIQSNHNRKLQKREQTANAADPFFPIKLFQLGIYFCCIIFILFHNFLHLLVQTLLHFHCLALFSVQRHQAQPDSHGNEYNHDSIIFADPVQDFYELTNPFT